MRRYLVFIFVFVALLLATGTARAGSIVVNGSFETNTAVHNQVSDQDVLFNLTNQQFTDLVFGAQAFGPNEELDLVFVPVWGIAAADGIWKVGLHTTFAGSDAFSLGLTAPVVAGHSYDLSFVGTLLIATDAGTLELGLSQTPDSFGSLIATLTPGDANQWWPFAETFVAPIDASYLTVRLHSIVGATPSTYAFIDQIALSETQVPEPASLLLLGAGLAGAFATRRRNRR